MNEPATACVNCGLPVDTPYCSSCGQPSPPKKLGFRTLWMDFQTRVYGLDGMFPRTLKDLTVRPGFVATEFVDGNRRKYYGPVGYFFLMITLWILLMSLLGIEFTEFMREQSKDLVQQPKSGSGQEQLNKMLMKFISDNLRIFSFLIIPFLALMGKLFFRKSRYNFIEHSVLPFYVQGHFIWFTLITVLLYYFLGTSVNQILLLVLLVAYYCYACTGFYTHQSKVKVAIKSFFVYVLGYLFFMVTFTIVLMVYVFSNPDLLNMLKPSSNR